jgi:DeoR/GlpR family transcriptional regulator of sugar metabolism
MLTEQRRREILARLKRDGRIVAKQMSSELNLSEDTIRRDLRDLAAEGLLTRVHGGALPASPTIANLAGRRGMASGEKQALARAGAKLVEAGQTVFIDGGTTNLELVRSLSRDIDITIITHSPTIASALEGHRAAVILIGGTLYKHSMVAVGAAAIADIARVRADLCFIGLTGLHPGEGGTTGDFEEAAVKRAILARSAEAAVLLTSEKIGAVSAHAVCALDRLATLVVPAGAQLAGFPQHGPSVIRA